MTHERAPASVFSSLRGRLLFLICLATLPAILFTFVVAQNERAAALQRTERDALHLARLASREHAHQIQGARELLRWLGTKLAREGMRSPIITDPDFLPTLLAGHPQLANIGVLAPDGRVLVSAYPLSSYRNWRDNPAFVAAVRSVDIATGKYIISPIFNRPTLNHAYAIRDAEGQVTAVLFNGLDLRWLSEIVRQTWLPEEFSLAITDGAGRVLADGGLAHPAIADTAELRIPGIADIAQSRRARMAEIRGAGVRRYFVAAPLGEVPDVYVAVSLPYERVLRQANSAFYRTLAALGLLTLFTIAAVFVAAEVGVLRALRSLARTVQRFGAGQLSARATSPRGHNELASLARAFNQMADSLAARHRETVEAQARLRALTGRLQVARETEATRISRELHDEVGQVLTSLNIDLSRLQAYCPPDAQERPCAMALKEGVRAMSREIAGALDVVRRISSDLRPGALDKLGLVAALQWQAREIEARTHLAVQVEADEIEPSLDQIVAVTLFRIAQEALTNVVRHAQASMVEIGLARTTEGLVLTVRDDGKGITMDAVESGESLGILGMRERALLIGGKFSIRGVPGEGTTVCVAVPLRAAPDVANAHSPG